MNGTRAMARRLLADPAASVVVVDDSEGTDDLARDMIEVLTSFCARRDSGPQAVLTAGSAPCGGAG